MKNKFFCGISNLNSFKFLEQTQKSVTFVQILCIVMQKWFTINRPWKRSQWLIVEVGSQPQKSSVVYNLLRKNLTFFLLRWYYLHHYNSRKPASSWALWLNHKRYHIYSTIYWTSKCEPLTLELPLRIKKPYLSSNCLSPNGWEKNMRIYL